MQTTKPIGYGEQEVIKRRRERRRFQKQSVHTLPDAGQTYSYCWTDGRLLVTYAHAALVKRRARLARGSL
jgi:hypothetical protein